MRALSTNVAHCSALQTPLVLSTISGCGSLFFHWSATRLNFDAWTQESRTQKSRILSGSFVSFPRALSLQPGYWESTIAVDPQVCGFGKSCSLATLVVCNYVRIFSSCAARFAAVCVNRSGRHFLRALGNQTSQTPIRQTHIRRPFVISDMTT